MTMIVKSTHHEVALPELPEEIWQEIFCSVCDISSMDTSALDSDAPRLFSFPTAFTHKTLQKAKILQGCLLLVCKTWHRIALSSFYEHLVVSNTTGLQNLSQILHRTSLGLQSKRLDVFLCSINSTNEEILTSLLLILPELRILTFSCHRIPSILSGHILNLPHLRVLDCHIPILPEFLPTTAIQTVAFPLLYQSPSPGTLRLKLPNLRQVQITGPKGHVLPTPGSFPSVTSVNIGSHLGDAYTSIFPVISAYFPSVQYIGIKCNLADLNLISSQKPSNTSPAKTFNVPATVHTLGLSFTHRKARNRAYQKFCNNLKLISGDGLQVIRFGDPFFVELKERPSVLALVSKTIQDKGWRVEVGDMYV